MKRSAILVLLLATATVCAGPPGESPKAPVSSPLEIADLEAEFATLIPPLLEKFNVPGASVAVLVDREVVLLRGFGRLSSEDNAPAVDAHTVFPAASLSKPVVAFGVHRLLVEGTDGFELDRPQRTTGCGT